LEECLYTEKSTSGSHLNARKVEEQARAAETSKKSTLSSHLNAREGWSWWEEGRKIDNFHLQLAFEREGDGGGGKSVEMSKNSTSGSHLDAREAEVTAASKLQKNPPLTRVWMRGRWSWWGRRNIENFHLRLTFECVPGCHRSERFLGPFRRF